MHRSQWSYIWRTVAALALVVAAVIAVTLLDTEQADAHHVVQVSAGGEHTCALTSGGSVECWGANDDGKADAPAGRFIQVSPGGEHTCAVTSGGAVECWGDSLYGRTDAPAGRFSQVSAGGDHTCAVTSGGAVECWGRNNNGQTDAPAGRFSQVSAGSVHTCAVTSGGAVECWGDNRSGKTDAPAGRFSQVSAGGNHTCAVTSGGAVECWGNNYHGQTDAPAGRFSQVSAGSVHTCAVTSGGAVECWGRNNNGQTDAPAGRFSLVSAGSVHTCAVTSGGAVECWGDNRSGKTDAPAGRFSLVSAGGHFNNICAVTSNGALQCWGENYAGLVDAPSGRFSQVSAGWSHICAVRVGGGVECWGDNNYGQTDAPAGRFTQVGAGGYHTCAVSVSGAVECWGANDYGQTDAPAGRFSQVSAGGYHTCALRVGGAVECWGDNDDGKTDTPAGRFSQVSAGGYHTCALTTGGAVQCWGYKRWGAWPYGYRRTDAPAGRFSQVSAGRYHTCAVRVGGAVKCWPPRYHGLTATSPAGHFSQVSAGKNHTCAVTSSGAVQCWGDLATYHPGVELAAQHGPAVADSQPADQLTTEELTARIAARRLDDGRIEFALQAPDEPRILPGTRHFPRNAPVGRWLSASTISYHSEPLGQIAARRLADGRTEFSFVTPEGERLLPSGRRLPANPSEGWKRSSEIDIPLPGCRLSEPVEDGLTFPTRNVTIDDSGAVYQVTGAPLNWIHTPEQVVGDNVRLPAKWVRTGSDVRYLVCGDAPPTDQEHDRALFTAGYFYSTAEGRPFVSDIDYGYHIAQAGFETYLDHFEQAGLATIVRQGLQFMQLVVLVNNLHVAFDTAVEASGQIGAAAAGSWLQAELARQAAEQGLDLSLTLSSERLDAISKHPEEIIKQLAWPYVEQAHEKGRLWRLAVDPAREGEETLRYTQARTLLDWEGEIARGVAGAPLAWALKQSEVKFWTDALTNIPFGVGTALDALLTLRDSGEALHREALNDFDEWLKQFPPYRQLTVPLRAQTERIAQRHQELFVRLGIDPASLTP